MTPAESPILTAANLIRGRTYRVKTAFQDFDGVLHPVGEIWTFDAKNFVPHDDGLSLFVDQAGQKRIIRLQWQAAAQAQIIEHFADYVDVLSGKATPVPQSGKPRAPKDRIWVGLAIGGAIVLAVLCLAIAGFALWFANAMSYHPNTAPHQMDTFIVDVKSPFSVKVGQTYEVEVQIKNISDQALVLDSLEINADYLAGAKVNQTDPPYQDIKNDKEAIDLIRYVYPLSMPPHTTQTVKFNLTAIKAGTYDGQVLVCINVSTGCRVYFDSLVIEK